MSSDLQSLVHSWLAPHTYFIPHKELVGKIQATGGIKQGSKDAPLFWNLTMYLILHDLLAQYDHAWIIDHLVVYADDFHMRWTVHSQVDGLRAMHDLSFLMRVFGAYGLKINPHKSFAMLRLVGRHFHRSRNVGLADRPMAPCCDCRTWQSPCHWSQKRPILVSSFRTGHGRPTRPDEGSRQLRRAFAFYAGGSWIETIRFILRSSSSSMCFTDCTVWCF